jgi:hypothetical protein
LLLASRVVADSSKVLHVAGYNCQGKVNPKSHVKAKSRVKAKSHAKAMLREALLHT